MIDSIYNRITILGESLVALDIRNIVDAEELELFTYKTKTNHALKTMKAHCDSDAFITDCRDKARQKINRAIVNGKIHWNRLPKLITQNTKMRKDVDGLDMEIFGLSFAPHWISGFNTCNGLSIGCAESCLMFTGMGQKFMIDANGDHTVAIARIVRTILWFEHRNEFKTRLLHELELKYNLLKSKNIEMGFRPNVFSEVKFEKLFPEVFTFCENKIPVYDYVKDIKRIKDNPFSSFYNMTFSLSENNALFITTALSYGCNIAVVTDIPTTKNPINKKEYLHAVPEKLTINGITLRCIDGDKNDARFMDTKNKFVVLRGKGKTIRKDQTSFMLKIFENNV